jgi:hypothetical protein
LDADIWAFFDSISQDWLESSAVRFHSRRARRRARRINAAAVAPVAAGA